MKDFINQSVYKYFKEISEIPRQSGNEEGIKNYLIDFAKQRNLKYYSDKYNNVIIYKQTCQKNSVILHSHTDMVCVKDLNSNFDFSKDKIELVQKKGFLTANKTSLGADNGIGVAMILSVLDSSEPVNVEALFTATEETTMMGAYKVDVSKLKSKNLVCLDGFNKNEILTSTSSFTDFLVKFDKQKKLLSKQNLNYFSISVDGFLGGHSGSDIDKCRLNPHKILARILQDIKDYYLIDFYGGKNFNVIPSNSNCVIATSINESLIKKVIKKNYLYIKSYFKNLIKNIKIKQTQFVSEKQLKQNFYVATKEQKQSLIKQIKTQIKLLKFNLQKVDQQKDYLVNGKNFVNFINLFNQGVLIKNKHLQVETSQNLSEVSAKNGELKIGIRSSVKNAEKPYIKRLIELSKQNNMSGHVIDTQPGFYTKPKSNLKQVIRQTNINSFENSLHIAVELGVLQDRIKNLDAVIISPTIIDAHSVKERVEIESINTTYNWLLQFLKNY